MGWCYRDRSLEQSVRSGAYFLPVSKGFIGLFGKAFGTGLKSNTACVYAPLQLAPPEHLL